MKPITHARKTMLLQYFDVLETQLRFALKEAADAGQPVREASFIQTVAARVRERLADEQAPEAAAPSLPQICKNLENVLDPAFYPDARGDPVKAVRLLRQQLREQAEFTPPPGGLWKPFKRAPSGAARRKKARPT